MLAIVVWGGVKLFGIKDEKTSEPIKIGVILPLTGNQASYGEGIKEGLEIALAEINVNSASKISLIYEDNVGETKIQFLRRKNLSTLIRLLPLSRDPHSILWRSRR